MTHPKRYQFKGVGATKLLVEIQGKRLVLLLGSIHYAEGIEIGMSEARRLRDALNKIIPPESKLP